MVEKHSVLGFRAQGFGFGFGVVLDGGRGRFDDLAFASMIDGEALSKKKKTTSGEP